MPSDVEELLLRIFAPREMTMRQGTANININPGGFATGK